MFQNARDGREGAPKADALPGCATPRTAEALRFPADLTQAERGVRGNERRNAAGTGAESPGIVPNHEPEGKRLDAHLVALFGFPQEPEQQFRSWVRRGLER